METNGESVPPYRPLWVRNLIADEGDPDRRNVHGQFLLCNFLLSSAELACSQMIK
jgi:hypothetical protein